MILVTHNLSLVAQSCDNIAVMYAGREVEQGRTGSLLCSPRHPYTIGLLKSFPDLTEADLPFSSISGHPPALSQPLVGCCFAERCPLAEEPCRAQPVALTAPPDSEADHVARCRRTDATRGVLADKLSFKAAPFPPGELI